VQNHQTYAYLKRLGYVVQRASVAEELRRAAANKDVERPGAIASGRKPNLAIRQASRWLSSVLKALLEAIRARALAAGTLVRRLAGRSRYGSLGTTACGLGAHASYRECEAYRSSLRRGGLTLYCTVRRIVLLVAGCASIQRELFAKAAATFQSLTTILSCVETSDRVQKDRSTAARIPNFGLFCSRLLSSELSTILRHVRRDSAPRRRRKRRA
jgi:hypothetical protein